MRRWYERVAELLGLRDTAEAAELLRRSAH